MKSLFTCGVVLLVFVSMALAQNMGDAQSGAASPQPPQSSAAQGSAATAPQGASTSAAGGGVIGAVLDKTVDAKKAKEGDRVIAKTIQNLKSRDGQVIPRNSKLIGHVAQVQARGKGQDQSTLGIVFDTIQVGKDKEMPFHAVIQALAPPLTTSVASDMAGGSEPGQQPGTGGTAGGVNASGAPITRPAGSGNMGDNAGAPPDEGAGASTSKGAAGPQLTSTSQGAMGMKNVQLSVVPADGKQTSMLTSTNSNVKLESGTRLVLRLTP